MEHYDGRDWYPELEGHTEINLANSEIRRFYAGANIFITGGAGFLGGLTVEKIARSCPDFGKIYLLLRPKRGHNPSERLNMIFQDEVFDKLKKENPSFITRVHVMEGDLGEPVCGLSEENQRIIRDEVHLIFHVAACLRMVEPLTTAYTMNVRATKDLLDLATTMSQLKSFIYVSTAYSNCRLVVSEKFYRTTYNWKDLQDLVEVGTEQQLQYLAPKLVGRWVNTYALTKAIAEDTVKMYAGRIPVAIARPSQVIGCNEEPKKNWINNIYGVTGVTAGGITGVIRVGWGDMYKVADLIPADYVVNTIIAIPWQVARQFEEKVHVEAPIYNVVSSPKAPTTWLDYYKLATTEMFRSKIISSRTLGECSYVMVKSKLLYQVLFLLFHISQGLFVDGLLRLRGKEPMLIKGYMKIMRFNQQMRFFRDHEWKYEQHNVDKLLTEMNEDDKKLFPFDMTNFDWPNYHLTTGRAITRYIIKSPDDIEDPTKARVRYMRFVNFRKNALKLMAAFAMCLFVKLSGRAVLQLYT